jgi:DNA-directed RNA polymerase specialized sigma24 family protein
MSSAGSVTVWLGKLCAGDDAALARLHQRFWPLAVARARRSLEGVPPHGRDEEDIANSAFLSLYEAVRAGRVPLLENRHHLLALLSTIVACKAVNERKRALRQKRGGGRGRDVSDLEALAGEECSPAQQVLLDDCYDHFINGLAEGLRPFAELHLAGFTHREIAVQLNCVERTVERKLARVLARWQEMAEDSVSSDVRELLDR